MSNSWIDATYLLAILKKDPSDLRPQDDGQEQTYKNLEHFHAKIDFINIKKLDKRLLKYYYINISKILEVLKWEK
jgi:hypothetical protein